MSMSCHLFCSLSEKRGGPRIGVSIAQNDPVSTSPSQTFLQEWMLCHMHGLKQDQGPCMKGLPIQGLRHFLGRLAVGFHTEFHNHIGEV